MKISINKTYKYRPGDYDTMSKIESNLTGEKMTEIVSDSLKKYYQTYKKNPFVSSIKITMDDNKFIVNWQVTIEESPDGKAYVGLLSTGSVGKLEGEKGATKRAFNRILSLKEKVLKISKRTEISEIADFNFQSKTKGLGLRQIFTLYTNPESYPYLLKSENKSLVVGKVTEEIPDSFHNNGDEIPSLHYLKVMNSIFNRNTKQ